MLIFVLFFLACGCTSHTGWLLLACLWPQQVTQIDFFGLFACSRHRPHRLIAASFFACLWSQAHVICCFCLLDWHPTHRFDCFLLACRPHSLTPSSRDRKCWCFLLWPLQATAKDNYCFFAAAATGCTGWLLFCFYHLCSHEHRLIVVPPLAGDCCFPCSTRHLTCSFFLLTDAIGRKGHSFDCFPPPLRPWQAIARKIVFFLACSHDRPLHWIVIVLLCCVHLTHPQQATLVDCCCVFCVCSKSTGWPYRLIVFPSTGGRSCLRWQHSAHVDHCCFSPLMGTCHHCFVCFSCYCHKGWLFFCFLHLNRPNRLIVCFPSLQRQVGCFVLFSACGHVHR